MKHARLSFKQKPDLKQARLQLTYTICYYTEYRINDTSKLTKNDIINAQGR